MIRDAGRDDRERLNRQWADGAGVLVARKRNLTEDHVKDLGKKIMVCRDCP